MLSLLIINTKCVFPYKKKFLLHIASLFSFLLIFYDCALIKILRYYEKKFMLSLLIITKKMCVSGFLIQKETPLRYCFSFDPSNDPNL